MSWWSRKATIDNTRATVPFYRDVRDRTTWELIDTMYYNFTPPIVPPNTASDNFGMNAPGGNGRFFGASRRLLREDADENYTWDGSFLHIGGYNITQTNVSGKFNFMEDIYMIGPNNSGTLSAYCLFEQLTVGSTTTIPFVIYAVATATGIWVQATSVIVRFAPAEQGGERTVQVLRALN